MVLDNQGVYLQIITSNSAGFSQALEFYNNNTPASQVGYDFDLEIREKADKTSKLLVRLSTEDDTIIVASNVVTLNIDAATLEGFAAGTSGASQTSGTSGTSGSSGTSGTSGNAGTSTDKQERIEDIKLNKYTSNNPYYTVT